METAFQIFLTVLTAAFGAGSCYAAVCSSKLIADDFHDTTPAFIASLCVTVPLALSFPMLFLAMIWGGVR